MTLTWHELGWVVFLTAHSVPLIAVSMVHTPAHSMDGILLGHA
jgi:hypothetical protein